MQPTPFELPRVGVVITCHNYRDYVDEAIRSVLAQTYQKWDCAIFDDASTDGSADHVRQLLEAIGGPRLLLLARPQNGSLRHSATAWHMAMRRSWRSSMLTTSGCRTSSLRIFRLI